VSGSLAEMSFGANYLQCLFTLKSGAIELGQDAPSQEGCRNQAKDIKMTTRTPGRFESGIIAVAMLAGSLIASTQAASATPAVGEPPPGDVVYILPDDPAVPAAVQGAIKQKLTVTADGWIHYASLVDKAGIASSSATTSTATVKGTRVGAGCQLPYAGEWTPEQGQVFIEETDFRPETCESRIRVTRVTQNQVGAISRASGESLNKSVVTTPTNAANAALTNATPAAALTTYLAHNKTLWIDPINITIASQAVNLKWKSNKTLVDTRANRYGFVGKIVGVPVDKTRLVSSSTSTSGVTFTANATFENTDFANWVTIILGAAGWAACGFPSSPLATFRFKDVITGSAGATFTYSWSDSKSGACTNLVHHGQDVGSGWVS
jgi:hypothetical protein